MIEFFVELIHEILKPYEKGSLISKQKNYRLGSVYTKFSLELNRRIKEI